MSDRFQPLLNLSRRQQELVAAGRFEDLPALVEVWTRLSAGIDDASPADRPVLEEIEQIVWSTIVAVDKALHDTALMLSVIQRGREAIGSYVGQTRPAIALNVRG